ncbi:MAG: hypothetical protein QOI40_42, partial [Alphaproteobacteria bacterium]|nr:hypothetical protein [Alphaproteobacteria bacterium]
MPAQSIANLENRGPEILDGALSGPLPPLRYPSRI